MVERAREKGQAERIVDALFEGQDKTPDLDGNLSISDLEQDIASFNGDLDVLSLLEVDVPALEIGDDLVPVALSTVLKNSRSPWVASRPSYERFRHSYFADLLREELALLLRIDPALSFFRRMTRSEASAVFRRRAVSFLAARIAAVRRFGAKTAEEEREPSGHPQMLNMLQRRGGQRISTPGCSFTVTANSPGLRVYWSGAYFVSGNYFGHPTSPTTGVMQAGTYIFGVDGGAYGNVVNWDNTAICSLPGRPSIHLNF